MERDHIKIVIGTAVEGACHLAGISSNYRYRKWSLLSHDKAENHNEEVLYESRPLPKFNKRHINLLTE